MIWTRSIKLTWKLLNEARCLRWNCHKVHWQNCWVWHVFIRFDQAFWHISICVLTCFSLCVCFAMYLSVLTEHFDMFLCLFWDVSISVLTCFCVFWDVSRCVLTCLCFDMFLRVLTCFCVLTVSIHVCFDMFLCVFWRVSIHVLTGLPWSLPWVVTEEPLHRHIGISQCHCFTG